MDQVRSSASSRIFNITSVEGRDDWDEVKIKVLEQSRLVKHHRRRHFGLGMDLFVLCSARCLSGASNRLIRNSTAFKREKTAHNTLH